jgi:hypothetical protein
MRAEWHDGQDSRPKSGVLEPHVKFASQVRSERWLAHLFFSPASARNPRLLTMFKTAVSRLQQK